MLGQRAECRRPLRQELRAEVGAAEGEQVRRAQPERAQQQGGDQQGDQDRLAPSFPASRASALMRQTR